MSDEREDKPIALDAYDLLAESYAALVDTKPHNAYYERPATLSLLPDVRNKKVLDAGCGPGVYSEWLADRGAEVVAFDVNEKMVQLARERLGTKGSGCAGRPRGTPEFSGRRFFRHRAQRTGAELCKGLGCSVSGILSCIATGWPLDLLGRPSLR